MTTHGVAVGVHGFSGHDTAANTDTTELLHILDTIEVPIVVLRRDFIVTCFNKAAAYLFGLSPADIGRHSRDTSVLADFCDLEEQCSEVITRGLESRVDFRDGDQWFVVRISPLHKADREITGTVLTFTNVTAFRASIDHAIYERECTKAILNTVGEPVVVLSADQRIQSGNRAFYTMFGVSRDETQKVPLYEFRNGALAAFRQTLDDMLAGMQDFEPVEVDHVLTADGQRTLIVDARPLSLPGHSERRVLITFQDITARKQAEAAKHLQSEEALAKARSELAHVSRITTLGALTASIAHEVNQPLSGIITNASTCMRMLDADPPNLDGARETVKRTIRDSRRACDVISRLRALFSKKDGAIESVDLNEVTRELIALSLSDLQTNRVMVTSELAADLPLVTGDRVQLQQVILNLLRNASDAMSCVDERPRQLLIRTELNANESVCLSVRDTGVGFAAESINKLFDAFYTTKSDGMGIGLSVSRSIIENHQGRLWAAANDGPGATFSFSIPCPKQTDTKVL